MKKSLFIILLISLLGFSSTHAQNSDKLTVRQVGKTSNPDDDKPERNFRMTLGGGYAYRLGKIDKTGNKEIDDLTKKLRSGYALDIEAQYFFQKHWGIALNANYVKQSKKASGAIDIPNQGTVTGYEEFNKFIYVGPSFVTRFENDKFGFYAGLGYGPIFWTNEGEADSPRIKAKLNKTAFGSYLGVSGEYRINPQLGVGLKVALTAGSVKYPGYDEKQNISNLLITGFISFRTK